MNETGFIGSQEVAPHEILPNGLRLSRHVARTTIVEDAWERGQVISIHSWIYRLDNGIINPLSDPISTALENLA